MSEKERVLKNILLQTTRCIWDRSIQVINSWTLMSRHNNIPPQFIPREMAKVINMPLKPGDIVKCSTNPNHDWGISEYREPGPEYSSWILKEIGSDRLLRMFNEDLEVLRFMPEHLLYTGLKYKLWNWAQKAFWQRYNPEYEYTKRFGGAEFVDDKLIIWSRSHIWRTSISPKMCPVLLAQPKKFVIEYDKKIRLKDIVFQMIDQGFAEDYEYLPNLPEEGQFGYVSFTAKDIQNILGL